MYLFMYYIKKWSLQKKRSMFFDQKNNNKRFDVFQKKKRFDVLTLILDSVSRIYQFIMQISYCWCNFF